jgi:hypothetical protein
MTALSRKTQTAADRDNHAMRIHDRARWASLFILLALSACSPSQNWREVTFEATALKAQLPCKPDRTTRAVPLGGAPVELQVVGCESGSAMVAVMTAALAPGADAHAVLLGWQKATWQNAKITEQLASTHQQPWHRPGMLPLTASVRVQAPGLRANGEAVTLAAVWGALPEGDHVRLVHAVVYDKSISPEMANTLFDGIKP